MADPSDIFRGTQRHQPLTLASFLEYGSGSDTEDPPTLLSLDLFHHRRSPDLSPLSSPDPDPGFLGLGLGLGFPDQEDQDRHREQEPEQEDQEDWAGDEFFICRRISGGGPEFSRARFIDEDGLGILGFESDSDPDEQIISIGSDPIVEESFLPLCWDCLRIDGDDRSRMEPTASITEYFEWEEIDGRADIVSNMIREEEYREELSFGGTGDEESNYRIQELDPEEEEEEEDEVARTGIEWEVLLTMHHLGTTESYHVEEAHDIEDGFIYTSEYDDFLFGQFQEHDVSPKVGPPTARSVVEGLPTVVGESDANCAVCKDEISADEKAKKLPCCHCYHEECILPWLGMRNTCPLCRYELPTEDAEYESRKARNNRGEDEEVRGRYGFETLSED